MEASSCTKPEETKMKNSRHVIAPSCQELTEEEIAQMNRELGELAIQRRFVKQISVPVGVIHLICLEGSGYLVSAEISHFLWTRDILHTMLMMKRVSLPHRSVDVESHQELFAELVRYNVPGVMDGEDLVDPLTLYPITCVPRVFAVFKNMKNEHDVKGIIEDIIAEFDASDPYWTSADEREDELAELCSEPPAVPSPPPAVPSPPPAPLRLELLPPVVAEPAGMLAAPSVIAGPEEEEEGTEDSADLLPEMQAVLTQLQQKRRRKVEATRLGLEGTGFLPEDVIGDDLRRMDAQIASFQRRIDALVESRAAAMADSSHLDSVSVLRPASVCRPARTNSISMNPDAPEFVHPGKDSVYASADNTLCASEPDGAVHPRPRAPVELRAPDGTPIDLDQLVSRARSLQRRDSGDGAAPAVRSPPRKPVELRTPDGRPVQLGRPVRAASTPHGSPPALSVVSAATAPPAAPVGTGDRVPQVTPLRPATPLQAQAPPYRPQSHHQPPPLQAQPHPQPHQPQPLQPQPQPLQPQPHHPQPQPLQPQPYQPQPQPVPAGHQPPRFSQPLRPPAPPPQQQPPPQPQQPQPQWQRQPAQQPTYGMPLYPAYQQPYLAYQQMYQFPPRQPLMGVPLQYGVQPGFQPGPAQYPQQPPQQPPPPPPPPPPAPAYPGK